MKFLKIILPLILLVIFGFVLFQKVFTQNMSSAKLTTLSVALDWTPNTDHTGLYVAMAKGWYKQQGIAMKILPYAADVSSSVIVKHNKADIGIASINDIVGNAAKGNHLVSIGSILAHNTSGFIVLADSGITSPKDLDGKIYGGYGSPFEDAVVGDVIKKDGGQGSFRDVTLNVQAMQALESKRIDFVWGLDGWEVVQAKTDGYAAHFFPIIKYGIPDAPSLYFIVTPEKIKQNPDILKKFMLATSQGYEYAQLHPKESAQILLSETPKGTLPNAKFIYDSQQILSHEYVDSGKKWGEQSSTAWHAYPQFMLDAGAIKDVSGQPVKTLNFDSLFTNQFLP